MSQVSAPVAARVFRRHPLRTAVGALVLSVVFSAAVLFLLPKFLPRTMNISTRGTVVLVVAIAITLVVWIGSFWLRNIRVVVTPDTVQIGRAGKVETFARDVTGFRSHITEHRTNGFRSGTTRALIVLSGGREITVELPGFTRATFNELMALLTPVSQPVAEDPVEAARVRASLPSSFTVDASDERRIANGFLITAIVLFAVALAFGLMAFMPGFGESDFSALILLLPFGALGGIGFAIGAAQRRKVARSAPAQVWVSHHGLRIGDTDHPYDQLSRIWVTPPAYDTRRIRIERPTGRSVTHVLASPRIRITPDYRDFVLALRAETARMPGLVSLDLE